MCFPAYTARRTRVSTIGKQPDPFVLLRLVTTARRPLSAEERRGSSPWAARGVVRACRGRSRRRDAVLALGVLNELSGAGLFISTVLAFFAASDGSVNENLAQNFATEVLYGARINFDTLLQS